MVRRGALERCETGANPLETREKRKPVTPENDPRETGLSFLNGGGGGNRTPVRKCFLWNLSGRRESFTFPYPGVGSHTHGFGSFIVHGALKALRTHVRR